MPEIIGQTINNRYRVDAFVGRGGMAEVFKVWDNQRSVPLAMKILHEDLAEDIVFLRRFKREAHTLARLQHPNIVRFYGLEEADGLAYILMDFVDGITLRKEIARLRKPFPLDWLLEVLQPVCSALHYAHSMGFVHCDVKPANIMLHRNGTVFLSDFGIARMSEAATTTTMVGAGTPAYMSPEQVRGLVPTPQTDIYALGIVLYEMVTGGERPFTGERASITGSTGEKVRWEQSNMQPVSPRLYNPKLPVGMEKVILRSLEKIPVGRYPDAVTFFNALERGLDGYEGFQASSPPIVSEASGAVLPSTPFRPDDANEGLASSQDPFAPLENGQPKVKGASEPGGQKRFRPALAGIILIVGMLCIGLVLFGSYMKMIQDDIQKTQTKEAMLLTEKSNTQISQSIIEASTQVAQNAIGVINTQVAQKTIEAIKMQVTQKIGMTHTAESVNTQIALDKVALIQTEIAGTQITQKRAMLDNITATAPFSTQQLVLKVGSRQTSEKDKMVMVYVPAGDFIMGYKDKQKQVYLDSFWIGFVAWK